MVPQIKAQLKAMRELDELRELKQMKKGIEESRRTQLSQAQGELEALQRQGDLIRANSARGIQDWRTAEQHALEIDRLHTDKFAMAKANAELQAQIEKLEQSKDQRELQVEELDQKDPAEGMDLDPNAYVSHVPLHVHFPFPLCFRVALLNLLSVVR